MLAKALSSYSRTQPSTLTALMTRGVYAPNQKPYVFINQHTKVLVQGMTGKHVSKLKGSI